MPVAALLPGRRTESWRSWPSRPASVLVECEILARHWRSVGYESSLSLSSLAQRSRAEEAEPPLLMERGEARPQKENLLRLRTEAAGDRRLRRRLGEGVDARAGDIVSLGILRKPDLMGVGGAAGSMVSAAGRRDGENRDTEPVVGPEKVEEEADEGGSGVDRGLDGGEVAVDTKSCPGLALLLCATAAAAPAPPPAPAPDEALETGVDGGGGGGGGGGGAGVASSSTSSISSANTKRGELEVVRLRGVQRNLCRCASHSSHCVENSFQRFALVSSARSTAQQRLA